LFTDEIVQGDDLSKIQSPRDGNGSELGHKLDNFNLLLSAVRGTIGKVERDVLIVKKAIRTLNGARHGQPQFALVQQRDSASSDSDNEIENVCAANDDSSVRKIRKNFFATCDTQTDDGGWIVIQNRFDGSTEFFRGWNEYKDGFGNIAGEFWMGLEKIYELTSSRVYELMIVMESFEGEKKFAKYSAFGISGESSLYTLNLLGKFSGDAEDSLKYHAGMKFSTFE
jgi:Fibrinogen beta and gamma chains, C-terminal globular domain